MAVCQMGRSRDPTSHSNFTDKNISLCACTTFFPFINEYLGCVHSPNFKNFKNVMILVKIGKNWRESLAIINYAAINIRGHVYFKILLKYQLANIHGNTSLRCTIK